MKQHSIGITLCVLLITVAGTGRGLCDEAAGLVADDGFGAFTLNENGTVRRFNLSTAKTQYDPTTWRPGKGDEVTVSFTPTQSRRGETVLAVVRLSLVKAGPNTVTNMPSPTVADIVEVGASGVRAKIASGQLVKFSFGKGTKRVPSGWAVAVGEKAKVTFHLKPNRFTCGILYAVDQIEKVPAE